MTKVQFNPKVMYHNQPTNATINLLYPIKSVEKFAKITPKAYKGGKERTFYIENRGVAIHMVNLAIFLQMPFIYSFVDSFHCFTFKSSIGRIDLFENRWEEKKKQIMEKTGIEADKENDANDSAFKDLIRTSSYENPKCRFQKSEKWNRFNFPLAGGYALFSPEKKLLIGHNMDVFTHPLPPMTEEEYKPF